jgi:hypothetical protein
MTERTGTMDHSTKDYEIENLGSGVLVFKNVIDIDHDFLIPYIAKLQEKVVTEDFTIIHDDSGVALYAVNRSGHRFELDKINDVNRIMGFATTDKDSDTYKFFERCEEEVYQCLIRYVEHFPLILGSLWWKEQGHVVAYKVSHGMGYHSDNDVNYQPGAIPDLQLATRHVVGCILYFNDSVDSVEDIKKHEFVGGELDFKYLDICYKPKSGDIVFFPSNYMAVHEVKEIKHGARYAYISYFSHGSPDVAHGINPADSLPLVMSGQVWIPQLFDDYKNYIAKKYGNNLHNHLTEPFDRVGTSSGTQEEVMREKSKNGV